MRFAPRALAAIAACLAGAIVAAAPLDGTREVRLIEADGSAVAIASVTFTPDGAGSAFALDMDYSRFDDHFLSMRPFKCLAHERYLLCHLPYPYALKGQVSADDLTDLEYSLLFIRKAPSEYGINPYNGLYYSLRLDGQRLVGLLRETDLDVLAAPPEDGDLRPITADALYEAEAERHAFPSLVIE